MLHLRHTSKLDYEQCLIFHWGSKASEPRERARKLPPARRLCPPRVASPRGRKFSRELALFTRFTIHKKNKGQVVVYKQAQA